MGKLQDKLVTGKLDDYEFVRANSAGLVKELLAEIGAVRGAKRQVAERLGVAASVLSNIIAGKRHVPEEALKRLMHELQKEAKREKTSRDKTESPEERDGRREDAVDSH